MKIEIKIDPSLSEPRLVITAPVLTHDLEQLIAQLSENKPNFIAGFREEGMELLDPGEIYRFYSSGTKICAETVNGEYIVRLCRIFILFPDFSVFLSYYLAFCLSILPFKNPQY